ncbi:MAG: thioredoxin [Candidatus Saelkia tenebricola]|nr:thioredoxin [Candidatus Saelkia tenebricola]
MHEVKVDNFQEEVLSSGIPVVVDFWAQWCGPCHMITPILEEVSKDFEGTVKFLKLNVDENQKIASDYGIMSIPALILFKEGKPVAQSIGVKGKDEIASFITSNI